MTLIPSCTMKKCFKYCIVPMCKNTTKTAPEKVYFHMPRDANVRKKWCKAMRRDYGSSKSSLYCCEEHFNIEKDTENYMEYKIMTLEKGQKTQLRLRKDVVPYIFQCQKEDKLHPSWWRKAALKRIQQAVIKEALSETTLSDAGPSTASLIPKNMDVDVKLFDKDNLNGLVIDKAIQVNCPETVPGDEAEMEDEVPKVCRGCLASEVRMFDIAASGLQDTFEHVTGTELYTSDERPTQVCFVCCSLLQRFRAFCQMSRKAETSMTKLLKKGLKITEQEVSKRHRLMKPKLGVKKNSLIATHIPEDSNECATVEVKVEVENEVEDNKLSDSETEIKTEIGSEVKTGTLISERYPNRQNKTGEGLLDLETEGEIKIEIEEVDIEELDPFEAIEHTTVRDETCCCLQCAEAFPSQRELLKHLQNHTQKKLKQANSIRRNVKAKRNKRNVKVESRCKYCNTTFAIKAQLMTHVATEHGFGEFSTGQVPKRRKPNILKKTSKHNVY